ncbi:TPA: hypothetical protein ACXIMP_001284 [Enterobacter asburiae]|uniref:hypothetical protein n=1 Tax=Enterobacter asburiae TaxID=61645 RepID=UPI002021992D|nr:hypothetical protein [Enterobacter asburiae]MCL8128780.1 hypothetical protein [Enterobacter asburiae]MCM8058874.1 hypothetical protein [Enterobacter asburiae]
MKQKFIEWFTKNNNGCSPAMEDNRSFVYEMTQHMFEAYQAGVAEGEAKCAALAAKGMEVVREASLIYSKYNDTQMPDRDIVDQQTLQELYEICTADDSAAFLAEVRAQGVEMFADDLLCPDLDSTIREFAEQLRKGVQS